MHYIHIYAYIHACIHTYTCIQAFKYIYMLLLASTSFSIISCNNQCNKLNLSVIQLLFCHHSRPIMIKCIHTEPLSLDKIKCHSLLIYT